MGEAHCLDAKIFYHKAESDGVPFVPPKVGCELALIIPVIVWLFLKQFLAKRPA